MSQIKEGLLVYCCLFCVLTFFVRVPRKKKSEKKKKEATLNKFSHGPKPLPWAQRSRSRGMFTGRECHLPCDGSILFGQSYWCLVSTLKTTLCRERLYFSDWPICPIVQLSVLAIKVSHCESGCNSRCERSGSFCGPVSSCVWASFCLLSHIIIPWLYGYEHQGHGDLNVT